MAALRGVAVAAVVLLAACQGGAPVAPARSPVAQAPAGGPASLPPVSAPAEPAPDPTVLSSAAGTRPAPSTGYTRINGLSLRIRVWTGLRQLSLTAPAPLTASWGEGFSQRRSLGAGAATLRLAPGKPAPQRFHLFVKTFPPDQTAQAQAYAQDWRGRGYDAQIITLGNRFRTVGGQFLENRLQYVSLARYAAKAEAESAKRRLEQQGQWTWIEPEIAGLGTGTLEGLPGLGACALPLRLESAAPATLSGTAAGKPVKGQYAGTLEFRIGPDGLLEVYEELPLEDYLKGVLPSEMPASWPAPALGAQALAARSEVLANWGVKHKLEGFEYCAAEHCRAYGGHGGRHPAADAAVDATAGQVLARGGAVIPTVFSSNCGGWSENNENVWSSPPNPALRGLGDFPAGVNPAPRGPLAYGLSSWLWKPVPAYCSADASNFRWTRTYSAAELNAHVAKHHNVGAVRDIKLGERGVSGRLKSVEIIGTRGKVTVLKELPIRQAFGGLPSAMFILDIKRGPNGPVQFVFRGGGRGHGVGLCQHGARGMAARGMQAAQIVGHYFQGATVTRLD